MLLSVIVPTWNSVDDLRKLLDRWAASGADSTRLVVIDDGSEDGTLSLLAEHGALPGLLFIRQSNAGPGAARNLGLSAVDTPYVTFVDVDDDLDWSALSRITMEMQDQPSIDVLTGPLAGGSSFDRGVTCHSATSISRLHFLRTRMAVWGRIYKTALVRSLEPLFPPTRAGEDVVASVKVASASRVFGSTGTSFYYHHQSKFSLTNSSHYSDMALESLRLIEDLPADRALKVYALAASAKYFLARGDKRAALQSAHMAARCLR
jgi:glycosyltransferase involved in cell wall biosynthesis